jgi:hypothetical protein
MRRIAIALGTVLLTLGSAPALAQSGEEGAVCIHQFLPGISCTSTDISAAELAVVTIDESCEGGIPGSALVTFDTVLANSAAGMFDIALFLALDGGSALSGGNCYHDYLEPPLTTSPSYPITNGPWPNSEPFDQNDECGDMEAGTELTKTLAAPGAPLRVECVDTNGNGTVDVSVCVGWRAGSSGGQATCRDLSEALPAAGSRCNCERVELLPEPGAVLSLAAGGLLLAALTRRRAD